MARKKKARLARWSVCLDDHRASAAHLYNICRAAVWGIVEKIAQDGDESRQVDVEAVKNDALLAFDLPMEFGSSKKRKREAEPEPINIEGSLPEMPRNQVVPHHNVMRFGEHYVTILGVGPSHPCGSNMMVRRLGEEHPFEVPRALLGTVPADEQECVYTAWDKDFYFLMSLRKPTDVHEKYWDQRYRMFSCFDRGIRLDAESWYSVTYEVIGQHLAKRSFEGFRAMGLGLGLVVDCFSGCGGCTIPLAQLPATHVVAVDMDAGKLRHLRVNAAIYDASDSISLLQDDVLRLLESLAKPRKLTSVRAALAQLDLDDAVGAHWPSADAIPWGDGPDDMVPAGAAQAAPTTDAPADAPADALPFGYYSADLVVLSPPWGGPDYLAAEEFDLRTMIPSGDCFDLVALALSVAPNVILSIPRNTSDLQLQRLAGSIKVAYRIEDIFVSHKFKLKLVVFGPLSRHFARP